MLVLLGLGCWMVFWTKEFVNLNLRFVKKDYQRYKKVPLLGKILLLSIKFHESKFYFWFIKIFGTIYTLLILYIMIVVILRLF